MIGNLRIYQPGHLLPVQVILVDLATASSTGCSSSLLLVVHAPQHMPALSDLQVLICLRSLAVAVALEATSCCSDLCSQSQ